jgi:hypothetical protein
MTPFTFWFQNTEFLEYLYIDALLKDYILYHINLVQLHASFLPVSSLCEVDKGIRFKKLLSNQLHGTDSFFRT